MNKQTFLLITLLGCVSSFAYGQNFLSTSKEIAKATLLNSTVKGSAELGKLGIQMIKGGVSGAVNQKALLDNLYRQDGFHGYFKPGALPRLDLTSSVHFRKTLEPVSALYSSPLASFAPVVKQKADDVLALWKEGTTEKFLPSGSAVLDLLQKAEGYEEGFYMLAVKAHPHTQRPISDILFLNPHSGQWVSLKRSLALADYNGLAEIGIQPKFITPEGKPLLYNPEVETYKNAVAKGYKVEVENGFVRSISPKEGVSFTSIREADSYVSALEKGYQVKVVSEGKILYSPAEGVWVRSQQMADDYLTAISRGYKVEADNTVYRAAEDGAVLYFYPAEGVKFLSLKQADFYTEAVAHGYTAVAGRGGVKMYVVAPDGAWLESIAEADKYTQALKEKRFVTVKNFRTVIYE